MSISISIPIITIITMSNHTYAHTQTKSLSVTITMLPQGFQIWVNVPARHKMDDPQYGTEPPDRLPYINIKDGVGVRVLAGT
ncbi:hypothetical protein EON63_22160 [archaeon]|nr:MAG: hypothetical protein EON63_22160 [archaeon]